MIIEHYYLVEYIGVDRSDFLFYFCFALLLFYTIATAFQLYQLYLGSDMMYEMKRKRNPEPTLWPTQGIFTLPHHISRVWEELAFDDAVSFTQRGEGQTWMNMWWLFIVNWICAILWNSSLYIYIYCCWRPTPNKTAFLVQIIFTTLQHLRSSQDWSGFVRTHGDFIGLFIEKSGYWHHDSVTMSCHWANQSQPSNAKHQARKQQVIFLSHRFDSIRVRTREFEYPNIPNSKLKNKLVTLLSYS